MSDGDTHGGHSAILKNWDRWHLWGSFILSIVTLVGILWAIFRQQHHTIYLILTGVILAVALFVRARRRRRKAQVVTATGVSLEQSEPYHSSRIRRIASVVCVICLGLGAWLAWTILGERVPPPPGSLADYPVIPVGRGALTERSTVDVRPSPGTVLVGSPGAEQEADLRSWAVGDPEPVDWTKRLTLRVDLWTFRTFGRVYLDGFLVWVNSFDPAPTVFADPWFELLAGDWPYIRYEVALDSFHTGEGRWAEAVDIGASREGSVPRIELEAGELTWTWLGIRFQEAGFYELSLDALITHSQGRERVRIMEGLPVVVFGGDLVAPTVDPTEPP